MAVAETSGCTKGSAITHNNCVGIRLCSGGKCYGFKRYDSHDDSLRDFIRLWKKSYGGGLPTIEHAKKYTGKDRADTWLAHVKRSYNKP